MASDSVPGSVDSVPDSVPGSADSVPDSVPEVLDSVPSPELVSLHRSFLFGWICLSSTKYDRATSRCHLARHQVTLFMFVLVRRKLFSFVLNRDLHSFRVATLIFIDVNSIYLVRSPNISDYVREIVVLFYKRCRVVFPRFTITQQT